ncbi:GNAT family N-acetyltransferase [Spirosoma sp.]|uniref:GNAT family N-acetyltransferase n=1 Tax=Spirosoma sp. TaxID=1899569 RepID=UPI003B3B7695
MKYKVEPEQAVSNVRTYRVLFFTDQNRPVGYAKGEFRQNPMWYNGLPYFFLTDLTITDQTCQQQGIGSQILKVVEAFARKEGAYWIRGQMAPRATGYTDDPANERATNTFWGANGYGIKREIYDNSIRFWKPLQALSANRKSLAMSGN